MIKRKHDCSSSSEVSCTSPSTLTIYSFPPKTQKFSIPENIIFYISQNPSNVKVYEKLIKICKYFYLKNPITTFMNILISEDLTKCTKLWQFCKVFGFSFKFGEAAPMMNILPERVWLIGSLAIFNNTINTNLSFNLVSKIYLCDLFSLVLKNQKLTLKEFKLFASKKLMELSLENSEVKIEDGSIAPIETLFELSPNLNKFQFKGSKVGVDWITSETVKKLFKIPNFSKMKKFDLTNVPETFDFETFFNYLKINKSHGKSIFIHLEFNESISEGYKQRLQSFLDNALANEPTTKNRLPWFQFHGMTKESHEKIFCEYNFNE